MKEGQGWAILSCLRLSHRGRGGGHTATPTGRLPKAVSLLAALLAWQHYLHPHCRRTCELFSLVFFFFFFFFFADGLQSRSPPSLFGTIRNVFDFHLHYLPGFGLGRLPRRTRRWKTQSKMCKQAAVLAASPGGGSRPRPAPPAPCQVCGLRQ